MGNTRDQYEQTLNELKDQVPEEDLEDLRIGYNAGITEKKVGERVEVLLYAIESLDDAYQEGHIEDEETQQQVEHLQEWAQGHEYIDWTNKRVKKDQIDEDIAEIADSNQDPIPIGEDLLYEIDTILNEAVNTYNDFMNELGEYDSGTDEEPTNTEFGPTVLDPEEDDETLDSELEPDDEDDDLGTLFPGTEDDGTAEDTRDPSDTEDYDSGDEGPLFDDDLDESTDDTDSEDHKDDGFGRDDTTTDDPFGDTGPSDSTTDWGADPGTDRGDSDDTDPTGFDPIDPDDGDDGPTDWDDGSSDDTHDYGKPDDTLEWLGGVAFGEYKLRDFTLGLRGNRRD